MALINTTTTGVLGSTFFGDGSGNLTVQQNGVTQGIFGNQPAFSAYASTLQSISNSVYTKVLFDLEEFDTNNNFASSRFTPTIAGYYQVTAGIQVAATAFSQLVFYKNGTPYKYGVQTSAISFVTNNSTTLVYLNGTTDYVEVYALFGSTNNTSPGISTVYFQGILIKAT